MREENLNRQLQAMKGNGKSQDDIVCFLFAQKISITEAIIAIRTLYGIKLEEAKKIVSSNRYWSKIHEANQNLHDKLDALANSHKRD